jgi:protein-tyrosine phosphatase
MHAIGSSGPPGCSPGRPHAVIDTHCHLLPGLDDGPPSVADSLVLAHALVAQGVETAVCTPHWSRRFPTTHPDANAAAETLRAGLEHEGIPLRVVVSAELSDVVAATRPLAEIADRSIAGRGVIVELVSGSLPAQVSAIVSRLATAGLTAVLAHPERCRAVQADPQVLDLLRMAGAQVQVVAPSLTGTWGEATRAAAVALVASGRADLVASDAHDARKRPPEVTAAREVVVELLGDEGWEALTGDGPRRLLVGAVPSTA